MAPRSSKSSSTSKGSSSRAQAASKGGKSGMQKSERASIGRTTPLSLGCLRK